MLDEVVAKLVTPWERRAPVTVDRTAPLVRDAWGAIDTATLVGPDGADPSTVEGGIWDAMGEARPPRTLAQLSNVIPPTPQLYERAWRVRSLTLLSGRRFPIEEELAELDDALGDVDGTFCIDIGCSEGLYARHLARRGALVAAVDHSRPFLRRALRRAHRDGVSIAALRATAQQLPIATGVADAVVIGGSLNEIGDRTGALAEAARVLRPGGTLFVMSLVAATGRAGGLLQRALRPTGIEFPSLGATTAELTAPGFELVEQRVDRVVARTTLHRRP